MKFDPKLIPLRMKHLPRDRRGYPIPVIVMRDLKGEPHFTINDVERVEAVLHREGCQICGERLGSNKWFVGGPGSAFCGHPTYIDGPIHRGCGTFALQVCPYLAMPVYAKRIDAKTVKPENIYPAKLISEDNTMIPERPVVFVFANTRAFEYRKINRMTRYFHPEVPWREVQFWRHGKQIDAATARELVEAHEDRGYDLEDLVNWPSS